MSIEKTALLQILVYLWAHDNPLVTCRPPQSQGSEFRHRIHQGTLFRIGLRRVKKSS
jgi:hypothetical protein